MDGLRLLVVLEPLALLLLLVTTLNSSVLSPNGCLTESVSSTLSAAGAKSSDILLSVDDDSFRLFTLLRGGGSLESLSLLADALLVLVVFVDGALESFLVAGKGLSTGDDGAGDDKF